MHFFKANKDSQVRLATYYDLETFVFLNNYGGNFFINGMIVSLE